MEKLKEKEKLEPKINQNHVGVTWYATLKKTALNQGITLISLIITIIILLILAGVTLNITLRR